MPPRPQARKRAENGTKLKAIKDELGSKSIVLIGLMGAGKTAVGRRVATRLGLNFVDADTEIEEAAGKRISEIFADHGEAYFSQRRAPRDRAGCLETVPRCWPLVVAPI